MPSPSHSASKQELERQLRDCQAQLRERDELIGLLKQQVAQLQGDLKRPGVARSNSASKLTSHSSSVRTPPHPGSNGPAKPQSARPHAASPGPGRAGSPGPDRPASARPGRPASPGSARGRSVSPARPNSARPGSPASPGSARRGPSSQPRPFTASQRGGPITEQREWRGLSEEERRNPQNALRGPSMLTRAKHSSRRGEKERPGSARAINLLLDSDPHNDPIRYPPFKGFAFPPSDYIGPDDPRVTDDLSTLAAPGNALRRSFVFGYCGRKARSNLFYNADGRIVYHAAALGIVYDREAHAQSFFDAHDDDICSLDMHPDKVRMVSGQVGKSPKIYVWSSRPDANGNLQRLCLIHDPDQKRAIIGVSFSSTGSCVAAMGNDNNRSVGLYKWSPNQPVHKMRIGLDKGHNADVYQLAYNRAQDLIVAVGSKMIRFFGLKDAQGLSQHESAMWSKKGVFGHRDNQQDMMCVAFDSEGVTYAGTADGFIYRFAEQALDLAVKAHPLVTDADGRTDADGSAPSHGVCKVTALCFDEARGLLVSSGDDGKVQLWRPAEWDKADPEIGPLPVKTIDLHRWVNAGPEPPLRGMPVKMDDFGSDKDESTRRLGSPAAAHALCVDTNGCLLIGTVCNEIYEVDPSKDEPPMCYMQGHYSEFWGLSAHPTNAAEFCTTAEDGTLRVWDLSMRVMKYMRRLPGPGRSCAYSPDGAAIAVGIGVGGKAKGKPSATQGQWLLYKNDAQLTKLAEPPQIRFERIADIKFSPDGRFVAVASADNCIDIYAVSESNVQFRATLSGHSSYVRRLDWSADSSKLQSCCGAYELLYWRLWKDDDNGERRWRPHQEKTASTMRDEIWASYSCLFGWPVRGIWPEDSDGTDVNAVARSNGATSHAGLLATADDFGKVKLFRWPCVLHRAFAKEYVGHSAHVTNICFLADDECVVSSGGNDRAIVQWDVVKDDE